MTSVLSPVLISLLLVVGLAGHIARSDWVLQKWADDFGFHLLQKEYRHFYRGPFFWCSSSSQTVYRVTVEDKARHVRTGWVRCGSWWLGLWSNESEVRWDDDPKDAKSQLDL
jgi:hypothetical protein